jgi:hypothetical protein
MRDFFNALIYMSFLLFPAIVATRCASERRMKRPRNEGPYKGVERRDPR